MVTASGGGRVTLETGRAVADMMDDVLLADARSLTAQRVDWVIVGTPQSSEACGFMLRKNGPELVAREGSRNSEAVGR